ncbi:YccF domain-containing protein [uncultured Trichococcus sp.]|uniref:YccF domain-containing protein n=1 Tax=uncultured Trichococcus sp. TaxID=189665 RepID=UPI0029C70E26|nr:YccF domain-containing protein [uncultured Trichococcus sp.]
MNFLMNLIWFVLGGFISFISWIVIGILWFLTIVGIPIGMQCFKFAVMAAEEAVLGVIFCMTIVGIPFGL